MKRISENGQGWMVPLVAALALSMTIAGCSDDDGGVTDPNGGSMTLEVATQQAPEMAEQVVFVVENASIMANGLQTKQAGSFTYDWNEAEMRWESHLALRADDFLIAAAVWVQYLDEAGNPQQDWSTAESLHYVERDTIQISGEDDQGNPMSIMSTALGEATVTGLQDDTRVMVASASQDLAMEGTTAGGTFTLNMTVSWATLGNGLSIPVQGCPTGEVRYEMTPFHMDVVFDGSGTAAYTLYDGDGNVVPDGAGTEGLECGI